LVPGSQEQQLRCRFHPSCEISLGNQGGIVKYFSTAVLLVLSMALSGYADTLTFLNPAAIPINDSPAAPSQSNIAVSGLVGTISKVTVKLDGFNHTYPSDVGAILVGPGGSLKTYLFDGPGPCCPVSPPPAVDLDLTFDDAAATAFDASASMVSGTYKPSEVFSSIFDPPAPGGPYATSLSIFNGLSPNGTWSLFVQDFAGFDFGEISGGWSITFEGVAPDPIPEPGSLLLLASGLSGLGALRRRFRS
jgi:hypothetical protein